MLFHVVSFSSNNYYKPLLKFQTSTYLLISTSSEDGIEVGIREEWEWKAKSLLFSINSSICIKNENERLLKKWCESQETEISYGV